MIGVGTAGLGVAVAEAFGLSPLPLITLGMGALLVGTGSIATDLDHPKSFISNSIPSHIIRIALVILAIPVLAAVGALFTTQDVFGTWTKLTGFILGVNILRWALISLCVALGLMLLSGLLYKSLHHRGPLHSIIFALGVTLAACWVFWYFWLPWAWGLAFGWGWLWHILADGLTEEGVPFFWPFNDVRKHTLPVWLCGTGRLLLYLAVIAGVILLVYFQLSRYFA